MIITPCVLHINKKKDVVLASALHRKGSCGMRSSTLLSTRRKRLGYFSLISFEDCHSPWMLHIETAMSVPGLLVFIQAIAA